MIVVNQDRTEFLECDSISLLSVLQNTQENSVFQDQDELRNCKTRKEEKYEKEHLLREDDTAVSK